jgi:hypothetical protein
LLLPRYAPKMFRTGRDSDRAYGVSIARLIDRIWKQFAKKMAGF